MRMNSKLDMICRSLLRNDARALGLGAMALGLSMSSAAPLYAADAPSADSSDTLEEIVVVSSRKKEETIIDVPQAVTAFSEESLTQYNIQSFADYGNKIPNLSFNEGATGRARFSSSRGISIRGMTGTNTTSLYIDDTPIPVTQNPRIVDVERIEVLKGPQGTLYGSAAIGGTVRIITKQPSFEDEAVRYTLSGGTTAHAGSPDFGGSAIANFVLIPETLAVRTMGFVNHDSGYVTRIAPVTDGSDVMAAHHNTGEAYQYGASISALYKPSDSFDATFKLLAQREDYPNGLPLVYRGTTDYDPDSLLVQRDYNVNEYSNNDWWLPALTLNYRGDKWSATSSTSFYKQDSYDSEDVSEAMHQFLANEAGNSSFYPAYTDFGGVAGGGGSRNENFQQELRVSFNPMPGLSGLVGAYYQHAVTDSNSATRIVPGIADSGTSIYYAGNDITTDIYFATSSHSQTVQKAVFTDWSYTLAQWTVDAGLRKYDMKTTGYGTSQGFAIGLNDPVTSATTPQKSDGYSPKFSLSFEPDKETNVYASAAKGFRPGGGATTTPPLVQCQDEIYNQLGISEADYLAGYKSDSVWTYEVGAKKAINRFLVTGALFQTNWDDIQQTVSLNCGTSFTANAGAARIRGGEFELTGNITGNLSLRLGYGYNHGVITDDAGGRTNQKVGDKLADTPDSNATVGAVFTHAIGSGYEGSISADWSYVGSSVSVNNSTSNPAERGAYSLTNLRFGLRKEQDELTLYINNVFDKIADYGDQVPDRAATFLVNGVWVPHTLVSVSRPQQIGLQFRHGF